MSKKRTEDMIFRTSPKIIEATCPTTSGSGIPASIPLDNFTFYGSNGGKLLVVKKKKSEIILHTSGALSARELWTGELMYIRDIIPEKEGEYLYDRIKRVFIASISERKLMGDWSYRPPEESFETILVTDMINLADEGICYRIGGYGSLAKALFASKFVAAGLYGDEKHQVVPNTIGMAVIANYYLTLFKYKPLDIDTLKHYKHFLYPTAVPEVVPNQLHTLVQLVALSKDELVLEAAKDIKVMNFSDALMGEQFPFEKGETVHLKIDMKTTLLITKVIAIGDLLCFFTADKTLTRERILKEFDLEIDTKIKINHVLNGDV